MGLGKTYSTRYLADSNNNTGAAGQVLISTATGIDWSDGSDIIGGPYLPLSAGINFPLTGALYGGDAFFSGYIKFGGYSYIGEDLTETDSLTIASDNTESIFFAHYYPATSTYTTTMEISPSGELKMPMAADGDKLTVQSSLTPFNNIIEIGQNGSDGYLDVSAAGGGIVTHLSGYTGYASYFLSNVGIGNTTVGSKLDVSGSHNAISVRVKGDMGTGAYYYGYLFDGTNLKGTTQTNIFHAGDAVIAADTTITDYAGLRIEAPNVSNSNAVVTNNYGIYQASNLQKNYFGGNVGIGTTTPDLGGVAGTRVLTVASSTAERWGILELAGNRTWGGNQVGELKFISTDATNNGTLVSLTAINDPTATGTGGSLKFNTRPDGGSLTERMQIKSNGQVNINQKPNSGLAYDVLINLGTSPDGLIGYQTVDQLAANLGASTSSNWVKSGNDIHNTNSADVGIGITNPSGKFHVYNAAAHNNIYFTGGDVGGTGYDVNLYLNGGANNSEMSINMGIAGNADRDRIKAYQGNMYFRTNDSERIIITNTGKVGIGTQSPQDYDDESDNLVIAEGVNGTNPTPGITIACLANQATTGRGAIRFADGTTGNEKYRGALEYNHDGDNMFFRTSGTTKMSIGSSGDVKITTNGKFLQGVRNTGSATIDMIGFVSGTDTLQIKGGTSGAANAISFYDTGGFLGTWYNSNFGIGRTNPAVPLDVEGKIRSNDDNSADYLEIFCDGSVSGDSYIENTSNNIQVKSAYATSFSTGGSTASGGVAMFIDQNQKVGIGTSTPASELEVSGRISGGQLGNTKITRQGLGLYVDFNDKACISGESGTEKPIDLGPSNYDLTLHEGANFEYLNGIGTFYFDGYNDYIEVNNFNVADTSNTYEIWHYAASQNGWETWWDSGNERPLLGTNGSNLRAYPNGTNFGTIDIGKWYHVVWAFASDTDLDIYINGDRVAEAVNWGNNQRTGTFTAWLGGDNAAETTDGYIAIARTYTRQLTPEDVLQNYNAEVNMFATVNPSLGIVQAGGNVGIGISSGIDANLRVDANSGTLTQEILKVKGGGSGGNFGFLVEANNGDDLFKVDTFTYNSLFPNGNVGIGTTSEVGEKLNVNGNIITVGGSTNTGYDRYLKLYGNTQPTGNPHRWAGLAVYNKGGNNVNELAFFTGSGDTARTEKMRLDAGGSLGIGEDSPGARIDIKGVAGSPATSGTTQNGILRIQNATNNNTLDIGQVAGSPYGTWLQAADKSDLNPTYTYPILLNPLGGNVGIGDTTPASKLVVAGRVQANSGNEPWAFVSNPTSGNYGGFLMQYGNVTQGACYYNSSSIIVGSEAAIPFRITAGGQYAMHVDASNRNVHIGGTNNASQKLEVTGNIICSGAFLRTSTSADAWFSNGNSGTYTQTRLYVNQNNTSNNDANGYFFERGRLTDAYTAEIRRWVIGARGGQKQMVLDGPGTLTVAGDIIAYGTPSDKRLKENVKPIESALDKAMKLQGVTFNWKKSDSILDIKEDIGFIAQDVQKVVPELVRENKDGMLSMRHQGIAPILLEAIKELKAEIEELKLNKCNCNK